MGRFFSEFQIVFTGMRDQFRLNMMHHDRWCDCRGTPSTVSRLSDQSALEGCIHRVSSDRYRSNSWKKDNCWDVVNKNSIIYIILLPEILGTTGEDLLAILGISDRNPKFPENEDVPLWVVSGVGLSGWFFRKTLFQPKTSSTGSQFVFYIAYTSQLGSEKAVRVAKSPKSAKTRSIWGLGGVCGKNRDPV